ncbi:MAG: hypothetical protein U0U09_00730 [Cyclobacteriaceae bacterium]
MKLLSINSPELRAFLKYAALFLLLLNGIGAFIGSIPMMLDPGGTTSNIPLRYLEHSPFDSFLIPGIVLFVCNGVLSLIAFAALAFNWRFHGWLVLLQGVVLTVWIITQVIMLRELNFLQVSFGLIGIVLMMLGNYFSRFK